MGISMSLSMAPSLRQTIECTCCRQEIDDEKQQTGRLGFMLYGAAPYAICVLCHQEVPKEKQHRHYKARYRKAALTILAKLIAKQMREASSSPQQGTSCGQFCPSCGSPCEGIRGDGYLCECGLDCESMH